jgi:hypothetical protein
MDSGLAGKSPRPGMTSQEFGRLALCANVLGSGRRTFLTAPITRRG